MSLRKCELRIAALAGLGLALAACADEGGPPLADASEAIVACSADPDTIPEAVTWSSPDGTDTCQGRYRYDREVSCSYTNDPDCGACTQYKSCALRTPHVDNSFTMATHQSCFYDPESKQDICWPDWGAAESWCLSAMNARKNQIDSQPNHDVTGASRQLSLMYAETFRCDITVYYDTISYSPRPECGCQTYPSCTLLCDLETAYSEPGMSEDQVLALPGAADPAGFNGGPKYNGPLPTLECTTGEDLPSSQMQAKFDRVRSALDDPAIATPGSVADIYVRQLKLIAEYGDIGAGNDAFLRELYRDRPDVNPTCGANFSGDEPACDADLTWRYYLCTRLASEHVSAERRLAHQEVCTHDFIRRLESHFDDPSCPADAYVDSMLAVQRDVLDAVSAGLLAADYESDRAGWIATAAEILAVLHHSWYQPLHDADQSALAEPVIDRERIDDELTAHLVGLWRRASESADVDAARDQALATSDQLALLEALSDRRTVGAELDRRVIEASLATVPTPHTASAATEAPQPLPETGAIGVFLTAADVGPVERVVVSVDITDDRQSDLWVALMHPNGQYVTLHQAEGGEQARLSRTYVVHDFDGAASAGTWVVIVDDGHTEAGDADGEITSVELEVTGTQPGRPAGGETLAAVLGQGVTATLDHMNALVMFHDYACAVKDCVASPPASPLATLWRMMGALDDHATLAQLTGGATDPAYAGWDGTLSLVAQDDTVRAQLSALAASEVGAPYEDALAGSLEAWPAPARRLIAALRTARDRVANYEDTGRFGGDHGKFLQTAVHVSKRAQIRDYIERKATGPSGLQARNQDYESDILAIVSRVVQDLEANTNLTAVRDRQLALADEYDDLAARRAAHVVAAGDPANHEAELIAALESVGGVIDGTSYFAVSNVAGTPLFLTGQDAAWTPGDDDVAAFAASGPIAVDKDMLLSLNVTGAWAPKCSLMDADAISPDGTTTAPISFPVDGGVPNPLTGPEGYGLQISSGAYVAYNFADSDSTTHTASASADACASFGIGKMFGFSAKACAGWTSAKSWSKATTNSDGNETRLSAAFSGGVHLSNTPLPAAAAGSLVAVELPRGATSLAQVRDVHLVRSGNTAIRVAADSDVYLVVNDQQCANQDAINELTVTGSILASDDAIARNLLGRIRYVLLQVASYRDQLVATRDILPSELAAIRSQALVDVMSEEATGCPPGDAGCFPQVPLSSYPEALTAILNAFLDKEILRLERAVRIASIDRQLEVLAAELATVEVELANAERTQALVSLLPSWQMRNLREDYVRAQALDLSRAVQEYFLPVFALWHPDGFDDVRASNAGYLSALTSVDLTTPTPAVIGDLIALTTALVDAYDDAVVAGDSNSPELRNVILSLNTPSCPNPFFCDPGGGGAGYRQLDTTITDPIWTALELGGGAAFPVVPDDIYQDGSTVGQIACNRQLPVLHHMALVVKKPSPYGGTDRRLNGQHVGREQTFLSQAGPQSYTLINDAWLPFDIPVLYVSHESYIESVFDGLINSPTAPGVIGLSPFTTFQLRELDSAKWTQWQLHEAEELFLVMRVESARSAVLNPDWIAACADAP